MSDFVHLRLSTKQINKCNSFGISDFISEAVNAGQKGLAITDTDLCNSYVFYKQCLKAGLKPVIGCSFSLCDLYSNNDSIDNSNSKIVLLAKNEKGYKNIVSLINLSEKAGQEETIYSVRFESLMAHSSDLVCLSDLYPLLNDTKINEKKIGFITSTLSVIFGKDDYFIEIDNHGLKFENTINNLILDKHIKESFNIVAANNVYYPSKKTVEDFENSNVCDNDDNSLKEFYLKSSDEMFELFSDVPEAINNTIDVLSRCNFDFDKINNNNSVNYLSSLKNTETKLFEILKKRIDSKDIIFDRLTYDDYKSRLIYELITLGKNNYIPTFIFLSDLRVYLSEMKASLEEGYNSPSFSLVSYLLGLTHLDPLKNGLLFDLILCFPKSRNFTFYVSKKNISLIIAYLSGYENVIYNEITYKRVSLFFADSSDSIIPVSLSDGIKTSQFDMDTLNQLGFLTCSFIAEDWADLLSESEETISLDDKSVFDYLCHWSDNTSLPYLGYRSGEIIKLFSPDCFNDLFPLLCFIKRFNPRIFLNLKSVKNNGKNDVSIPDSLSSVLTESYGNVIYYEQFLQIIRSFSGYSFSKSALFLDGLLKANEKSKIESELTDFCSRFSFETESGSFFIDHFLQSYRSLVKKSDIVSISYSFYKCVLYIKDNTVAINKDNSNIISLFNEIDSNHDEINAVIDNCLQNKVDFLNKKNDNLHTNNNIDEIDYIDHGTVVNKIYVRVDNTESENFKKINNLIDIFEGGNNEVVFYSIKDNHYIRCNRLVFWDDFLENEFKRICLEKNIKVKSNKINGSKNEEKK